ncbi:MAG: hypothetical protein ACI4VQ_00140 [Clostridia bacterium]
MSKNKKKLDKIAIIILFIIAVLCSYSSKEEKAENTVNNTKVSYEISNIPAYTGEVYAQINNNIPNFTTEDMSLEEDYYSILENGKVRNGNDKN